MVAMFIVDRRMNAFVELSTRHVVAQEVLAAGVNALVSKDDQRAREQDIMLNHLAASSERILADLAEMKGRLPHP
jgi:hypothetical protein